MQNKWYSDALLISRDPSWQRFEDVSSKEAAVRSIRKYFEEYVVGYKVTDFLLCVYEQLSIIPSDIFEWQGKKYLLKEYRGEPVDFSWMKGEYVTWADYGLDPVQICFDVMRENGVRPWLTLRMNDAHYRMENSEPPPIWDKYKFYYKSDFYYEELEASHIIGPDYGSYMERCYNFAYSRIREMFVAYVEELLGKYDVFGIDLDFLREIYCLDYKNDPDCGKYMTDMIRKIREKISYAENLRGHRIQLMVRVPRSPEECKGFGFNVVEWCREGLVDAVSPCARWECVDSGIPVREWRKAIGENIALFLGVETLNLKFTQTTPEQVKGYAASGFSQGSDGTYLYNYHNKTERDKLSWNLRKADCFSGKREFTVTFQDITSGKCERYRPLPMLVNGVGSITFDIGKVNKGDKVILSVDFEGDDLPSISVRNVENVVGKVVAPVLVQSESGSETVNMTPDGSYEYDLSGIETDSQVTLTFNGCGAFHYMNFKISAEN